jgi:hypothetical protein
MRVSSNLWLIVSITSYVQSDLKTINFSGCISVLVLSSLVYIFIGAMMFQPPAEISMEYSIWYTLLKLLICVMDSLVQCLFIMYKFFGIFALKIGQKSALGLVRYENDVALSSVVILSNG